MILVSPSLLILNRLNEEIKRTASIKVLGILFDANLSWISVLENKVSKIVSLRVVSKLFIIPSYIVT